VAIAAPEGDCEGSTIVPILSAITVDGLKAAILENLGPGFLLKGVPCDWYLPNVTVLSSIQECGVGKLSTDLSIMIVTILFSVALGIEVLFWGN